MKVKFEIAATEKHEIVLSLDSWLTDDELRTITDTLVLANVRAKFEREREEC